MYLGYDFLDGYLKFKIEIDFKNVFIKYVGSFKVSLEILDGVLIIIETDNV